jgi:hypothetical protein
MSEGPQHERVICLRLRGPSILLQAIGRALAQNLSRLSIVAGTEPRFADASKRPAGLHRFVSPTGVPAKRPWLRSSARKVDLYSFSGTLSRSVW